LCSGFVVGSVDRNNTLGVGVLAQLWLNGHYDTTNLVNLDTNDNTKLLEKLSKRLSIL
jgi:hypothetical protein